MKIDVYCYDDVNNPRCGGGGALRELTVHRMMSARHTVRFYAGNFKGAQDSNGPNFRFRHVGSNMNYLISRITFAASATIRSLFSKSDIIAIPYSIYAPVLTFLFRPEKTVILFFHITGREVFRKYGLFGIAGLIAEKIVLAFGKNYITLTDDMAKLLLSRRPGIRTRAGYVGFDTDLCNDSPPENQDFILCLGRIDVRMKGLDILVPAFEKVAGLFPDMRLIIAGRGQETNIEWLRQRICDSPFHTRIQCLINVSDCKRKELLHHAAFVCMPSRFEGWNIAAIEAAACSKATLGTRVHGLMDAIKDGETGILVPPEDVTALADAMTLLLNDAELRERLGKNGYRWSRNFTWEKVARIQEDFYLDVLKGQKRQKTGFA